MEKVILYFLSLFCFFVPGTVQAQNPEHIESYQTVITVKTDGTINVREFIEYFFDSPRHGIYRNIPVIKTNENGKKYAMAITDISVTDKEGDGYPFIRSREGDTEVLKIGDADKTITGFHWYIISYTVSGALTYFPGHDELYWNSIGTDWNVPIYSSITGVFLPQSVPDSDLTAACYVGTKGAAGSNCLIFKSEKGVTLQLNGSLDLHEGISVVVGFPKGMVSELNPKEVVPFFSTVAGKITLVLIGVAAFLWYLVAPFLVIRKWWKFGRDPKPAMGAVSAWFSPPRTKKLRDLTPAETGALVDETVDTRDIYASLVDLARRGYMKIIETKKGVFDFEKQKDWKKDQSVQSFEKELLDAIFESSDRVSLKNLDVTSTFQTVQKQLYTLLVADGFFPEDPQKLRTKYYVLAGLALATGNLILFIVATIFGRNMPRKTLFGAEAAAVGKSLKNFLVSQDHKLAFQASRQMIFEKLLPYAIAFGVEEIWAKRFAGLGIKQPSWYESSSGSAFNSVVFAHAIGRSAATSFASSITSKSSTGFSSGFSGGSSGGGGGGGGGGSW